MNLIAERLNRGLSVNQASKAIGVYRATLEKLEQGRPIHPESAKKIADFYGVLVTDIMPVEEQAA